MLPKLPKLSNPFNQKTTRRRTPTLLQMEAVECGAAALGIIMSYYGRIVPLAQLRQDCGVSRDGSKAGNVLKAAKSYGMSGKGLKIQELDALKKIRTPYIVFWNFNHFLVVEGITKKQVFLNDPATGPRKVSIDEFDGSYTGVVLVLEPGEEFKRGGSKPSIFAALWNRLKGSLGVLLYCILAGFLLVIPGLAIPVFTQVFVQDVLIQNRYEWLRPLLGGIVITSFLNGFLTLLQLQFLRKMKIKLSVGMSSKFVWHILRLPVSFYAQRFAGEISSRVRLNDRLANLLSGQLATTAISVVMVVFYAAVMWQYNQVLTIIGIAFVLFNLAVLQLVSRQRVDANMRLMQQEGKVNGVAISGLQSMETLKASGLESDFFARWSGYYANSINARQEMDLSNQTIGTIPSFLSYITTMLVLVVGGLQVMDGNMKIGALVAFQALMQRFLEPVNSLVSLGNDLQDMEGSITRLDDVLQNPVDPQTEAESPELEKKGKKKGNQVISYAATQNWDVNITKLQGYVELENITFGYNRVAAPLIENLSLSLKPGQRVALVGGSGSGKSTVAKLVSGLYEPWDGEIRFDGVKRSHIPRQVLVNSIAMVEQDVLLFGGTVRDNLTLWDSTVPDRYLMRACEDAAIHEVVQSIPSGYNGNLLEGATNLSGGQRQRLEIARTLVNNPSILVMDEATSALDTETEKIIDQKLRQRGCTCIIVAHRLSTIRDCDEIIVFEKGKVVQRGTHEELQRVEGHYLQLVKSEGGAL